MCGIVGILGREPVAHGIVEALKRLEYRGYDSAGVATIENGSIGRRRAPGKLRNLEERLNAERCLAPPASGTRAGLLMVRRPRRTRIRTWLVTWSSSTMALSRTSVH